MTSQGETKTRRGDGLKGAGFVLFVFGVVIGIATVSVGGGVPLPAILISTLGVGLVISGTIRGR